VSAVLNLLIAGRARIALGWTQRAFARDAGGGEVPPWSPDATCWCVLGAVHTEAPDPSGGPPVRGAACKRAEEALYDELTTAPGRPWRATTTVFNDAPTTTHADILDLFDRAIAGAS